jgi:mRNA-degrading endonuclease toxin of MazEF toxin-antitoxin module
MNEKYHRVIVAPITSNLKKVYSFEYAIKNHPSISGKIMFDQIRSVDKSRLGKQEGYLSFEEMNEIAIILKFILGIQ